MQTRRVFMQSVIALFGILPFAGLLTGLPVRRYNKMFIVDGWVLTAADIEALKAHVR